MSNYPESSANHHGVNPKIHFYSGRYFNQAAGHDVGYNNYNLISQKSKVKTKKNPSEHSAKLTTGFETLTLPTLYWLWQ